MRFPRIRRPRLREQPINASTGKPPAPAAAAEPESPEEPRQAAEPAASAEAPAPTGGDEPESGSRKAPRLAWLAAAVAAVVAAVLILIAAGAFDSVEDEPAAPAPAPQPAATQPDATAGEESADSTDVAEQLGFPAFATANTTRVGGTDAASNAAGVALATYPSAGGSEPPVAVTLVAEDDWQAAVAASVLMAEPVKAPLLVASAGDTPAVTEQALAALDPQGSVETGGSQAFVIGAAGSPDGLDARRVSGRDPAALAASIERLHSDLVKGAPDHIVVVSAEQPGYAVPAAGWAARSGDPVLFARRDELPAPTEKVLKQYPKVPVYVLGPASAVSDRVLSRISRAGGPVRRIEGEDPVTNAIEFARYTDGTFGWNVNDPGHGFVVARADKPLDAAVASPLSATGTYGPMLLTDSAATLPGALRGYLLDVKPGYRTDPTRALYNHVWIIGDQGAIDVNQQAAIDDLAELALIRSGASEPGGRATDDAAAGGKDSGT